LAYVKAMATVRQQREREIREADARALSQKGKRLRPTNDSDEDDEDDEDDEADDDDDDDDEADEEDDEDKDGAEEEEEEEEEAPRTRASVPVLRRKGLTKRPQPAEDADDDAAFFGGLEAVYDDDGEDHSGASSKGRYAGTAPL
jgi:hypothetical protein